jgi:hypothetical protein
MVEASQLQNILQALKESENLQNYYLWIPLYLLVSEDPSINPKTLLEDLHATPIQVCAVYEILTEPMNKVIAGCHRSSIIEGLAKVVQMREDVRLKNFETALEATRDVFCWSLLEEFLVCKHASEEHNTLTWSEMNNGNFVSALRDDVHLTFPDPLPLPRLSENSIDFQLSSMMMMCAPHDTITAIQKFCQMNK